MPNKLYASAISYLDPADCGSSVGFRIHLEGTSYLEAVVNLSDCSRTVSWYLNSDSAIQKIDTAIRILQEFKREYVKARKDVDRSKK
jgi:hypothetical protein